MQTIYQYSGNEFERNDIINKINEINEQIQKEQETEEYTKERERELMYAQLIQGLKLSIK